MILLGVLVYSRE